MKTFNTNKYINPPKYESYKSYRKYIMDSSESKCAYCSIYEKESPTATFEIDHYKPKSIFPKYLNDINNLRLSCRRCNQYKSDKWIKIEQGCNRECETCNTKVCLMNIERFYDSMNEEISDIMTMDNSYVLHPINNSKVSEYTINVLRLNRNNLIKIRKLRGEIKKMEKMILEDIEFLNEQRNKYEVYIKELESINCMNLKDKERTFYNLAKSLCKVNLDTIEMSIKHSDSYLKTIRNII